MQSDPPTSYYTNPRLLLSQGLSLVGTTVSQLVRSASRGYGTHAENSVDLGSVRNQTPERDTHPFSQSHEESLLQRSTGWLTALRRASTNLFQTRDTQRVLFGDDDNDFSSDDSTVDKPCCIKACGENIPEDVINSRYWLLRRMPPTQRHQSCFHELEALASAPNSNGSRTIITR